MDSKLKEITPDKKKNILRLRNEGQILQVISKIVGRTHSFNQTVINNYNLTKSTISKLTSGHPSKLTFCERRHILKSVCLNPMITGFQIINDIQGRFLKKLFTKTPHIKF